MAPEVGGKFPESGVTFEYVPITDADPTACGRPQEFDASKEFKGKKVVLVSVPGAFTPGCQGSHLPPFIENETKLAEKGVDLIVFIAFNDAFVMNAWGKVNGVPGDSRIKFMHDKSGFSKQIGWTRGERNARYAIIIEKDGTISYAETDQKPGVVEGSSVQEVLAKL